MRAARLHGHEDIRVEDIEEPQIKPGHVKVRPEFNGLCGSDLHAFFVKDFPYVFLGAPHPLTGEQPPLTVGHEFAGSVVEVGDGVSSLKVGDNVAVMPLIADGTCASCLRGTPNLCRQLGFVGYHGGGGGLSDAVVVKEDMAYRLPENMTTEVGALVEPLSVGWHAVSLADKVINKSSTALVIGGGPVGCAVLLALVARGVSRILVSEISASRRNLCLQLGATHVFNPLDKEVDVLAEVHKLTNGDGVDAAFDCAGAAPTLKLACDSVRTRGEIVNVAVWAQPVSFEIMNFQAKEASWRSSLAWAKEDFIDVIEAIGSGKMDPTPMITGKIAIGDVADHGFRALHDAGGKHCKILVDLSL